MTTREYPRWLHHPSGKSVIAPNAAYESSLGEGWYDTPADFPSDEQESVATAEVKVKGKPGPKPKVKE